MGAERRGRFIFQGRDEDYKISKKDKFELVSCSVDGIYCKNILPEINELYARSELAHINKEYQKSAELLQSAYIKTLALKKPVCTQCVDFFQTSITETMENMQEEVYDMSEGFFHTKHYGQVYEKLFNFVRRMKLIKLNGSGSFLTKKATPAGADS